MSLFETEETKSFKGEGSKVIKWTPYLINFFLSISIATFLYISEFVGIPSKTFADGFYCKDPSLGHEFKGETVTVIHLYLTIFLVPFFATILTQLSRGKGRPRELFSEVFLQFKDFLIGFAMVLFVTNTLKMFISEPRPQFFYLCEPRENVNCTIGTYIEKYHCTSKKYSGHILVSAAKSFPSGHASLATLMGLYSSHLIMVRLDTKLTGNLIKSVLIAGCLCLTVFISASRITDRRHHWWDVLAGVVIGFAGYIYILVNKKFNNNNNNNKEVMNYICAVPDVNIS